MTVLSAFRSRHKFIMITFVTGFLAVGRFAVGHFVVVQFAVRTLCHGTVRRRDPCMQNTEETTFAKYAVDANLFRLGLTNSKKNNQPLNVF